MKTLMTLIMLLTVAACGAEEVRSDVVKIRFETTAGKIDAEIYTRRAPITAANFLRYVDMERFDHASFYRVTRADNDPMIEVIQGGLWQPWIGEDSYSVAPLAPIDHETTDSSGLTHKDGAISMARLEPGTAASEFFISVGDHPELDFGGARNPDGQGFAVFGQVTDGMDVVRRIQSADVQPGGEIPGQLLLAPVRILSVRRLDE